MPGGDQSTTSGVRALTPAHPAAMLRGANFISRHMAAPVPAIVSQTCGDATGKKHPLCSDL